MLWVFKALPSPCRSPAVVRIIDRFANRLYSMNIDEQVGGGRAVMKGDMDSRRDSRRGSTTWRGSTWGPWWTPGP